MHHLVQGLVDFIKPPAPYTISVAVDAMPYNGATAEKILETAPVTQHTLTKGDDIRHAKNVEKLFKHGGKDDDNSQIIWFLNKEQLARPNSTAGSLAWLKVPKNIKICDIA